MQDNIVLSYCDIYKIHIHTKKTRRTKYVHIPDKTDKHLHKSYVNMHSLYIFICVYSYIACIGIHAIGTYIYTHIYVYN